MARSSCSSCSDSLASSRLCRQLVRVFQSAQPRPRAHIRSSTARRSGKACRPSALRRVEATARSQAGSPTPQVPNSMTADSSPAPSRRRFPSATSPWNQRSTPSQGALRASAHNRIARSTLTWPSGLRGRAECSCRTFGACRPGTSCAFRAAVRQLGRQPAGRRGTPPSRWRSRLDGQSVRGMRCGRRAIDRPTTDTGSQNSAHPSQGALGWEGADAGRASASTRAPS